MQFTMVRVKVVATEATFAVPRKRDGTGCQMHLHHVAVRGGAGLSDCSSALSGIQACWQMDVCHGTEALGG